MFVLLYGTEQGMPEAQFKEELTRFSSNYELEAIQNLSNSRDVLSDTQKNELVKRAIEPNVYIFYALTLWDEMHAVLNKADENLLINSIIEKIETFENEPVEIDILKKISNGLNSEQKNALITKITSSNIEAKGFLGIWKAINASLNKDEKAQLLGEIFKSIDTFTKIDLDDILATITSDDLTVEQKSILAKHTQKNDWNDLRQIWQLTHDSLNEAEKMQLKDHIINKIERASYMPENFFSDLTDLQKEALIKTVMTSDYMASYWAYDLLRLWKKIEYKLSNDQKTLFLNKFIAEINNFGDYLDKALEQLSYHDLSNPQINALIDNVLSNNDISVQALLDIWDKYRESQGITENAQLIDKIIGKIDSINAYTLKIDRFFSDLNDDQKSALVENVINSNLNIEVLSHLWSKINNQLNQEDKIRLVDKILDQAILEKTPYNVYSVLINLETGLSEDEVVVLLTNIIENYPNNDSLNYIWQVYPDFLNFNQIFEVIKQNARNKNFIKDHPDLYADTQKKLVNQLAKLYPNIEESAQKNFALNIPTHIWKLIKINDQDFYNELQFIYQKEMEKKKSAVGMRYLRDFHKMPNDFTQQQIGKFLDVDEKVRVPAATIRKKMPKES